MAQVICNDGTIEEVIVGESLVANCFSHGGIKQQVDSTHGTGDLGPLPSDDPAAAQVLGQEKYTTTQKWLAVIGITAVCYFILYKAGSLK